FAALALAVATWFALGALTNAGSATPTPEHAAATTQPSETAHEATAGPGEGSHDATAEQGEARDDEKEQGFANVIGLIVGANPHAAWARFLEHWEVLVFSIFIALLLLVMAFVASRNQQLVPSGFLNGVELVVEGLTNFIISIIW